MAEWDTTAVNVLIAGGHNNLVLTRGLTMVSLAMHDALNTIKQRYEGYVFDGVAEPTASPEAAVATAARDVLVLVLPQFGTVAQQAAALAMADMAYSTALAGIHFRTACRDGIALGQRIGQRVVRMYLLPVRR